MRSRHYDDDWTVETWRIEPRLRPVGDDVAEVDDLDQNPPPLWKDIALASIIAALLWGAAAAMFS